MFPPIAHPEYPIDGGTGQRSVGSQRGHHIARVADMDIHGGDLVVHRHALDKHPATDRGVTIDAPHLIALFLVKYRRKPASSSAPIPRSNEPLASNSEIPGAVGPPLRAKLLTL